MRRINVLFVFLVLLYVFVISSLVKKPTKKCIHNCRYYIFGQIYIYIYIIQVIFTSEAKRVLYRKGADIPVDGQLNEGTWILIQLWQLKEKKKDFTITWKILAKARAYTTLTKRCNLCISEKFFIISKPHMATLNKRNELISTCRHRRKYILKYNN